MQITSKLHYKYKKNDSMKVAVQASSKHNFKQRCWPNKKIGDGKCKT